jgi:nicotinate (nicotinamide) nucleotide adenylyltransferase
MLASVKIAVYFGSFDPIHRNHVSLCEDLIKKGFHTVYLVPNQNNPMKPYAVSVEHRSAMTSLAINESELNGKLIVYQSSVAHHTWDGRAQVCDNLAQKHDGCQTYQIIGQDSYEKALERCHADDGINNISGRTLLVYPRQGCTEQIIIPDKIKNNVLIVNDYVDSVECSSTLIREMLAKNAPYTDLSKYLHQSVYEYIAHKKLYQTLPNTHKIIVVMGSPGSGKGTICETMLKYYPKYIHLSAGDFYRRAQANRTPDYFILEEEKKKGPIKFMEALNKFIIEQLGKCVVRGKYYLIDGLKPSDLFSFEQSIAPIDAIVVLNCQYSVAFTRMKARQLKEHRPDDNDFNIKKRLDNYYKFLWVQKETLTSYSGTGRSVINLNSQVTPDYLARHPAWKTILTK